MAQPKRPAKAPRKANTRRNSRATVSGPAKPDASGTGDALAEKPAAAQDLSAAMPYNPNKAQEYDPKAALAPAPGPSVAASDPIVGASTVSELNGSEKAGSGGPRPGHNPAAGSLDRVRVDSTGRALTTNQGVRRFHGWADRTSTRFRSTRLAFDDGVELLEACGIPLTLPTGKPDPGLIVARGKEDPADAFVKALARHRHFARETDPPRV